MRLAEILTGIVTEAAGPLALQATNLFRKEFDYLQPRAVKTLYDFIGWKRDHPTEPFNPKDTMFQNGNMRGYAHVHLIHGKVILIYTVENGTLYLLRIVPHKEIDGGNVGTLLQTMDTSKATEYALPAEQQFQLPAEVKTEIDDLIYAMAADQGTSPEQIKSLNALKKAATGSFDDFREFVLFACSMFDALGEYDEETLLTGVVDAYGGQDALAQHITQVLRHLNVR